MDRSINARVLSVFVFTIQIIKQSYQLSQPIQTCFIALQECVLCESEWRGQELLWQY